MNKRYAVVLLSVLAAIAYPGMQFLTGSPSLAQGLAIGHLIPMPFTVSRPSIKEQYATTVVEAGPFNMCRKYVSMEGPLFVRPFKVQDLLVSKKIILPETSVRRVENMIALCNEKDKTAKSIPASKIMSQEAIGLVEVKNQPRKLYWYKGAKVEVIDEKGRVMPCSEFLCHLGVEIHNPANHRQLFPQAAPSQGREICTLARGITNVMLPSGFGVPVASDEQLRLILMAYKLVDNTPRRIKLRCTLYFAKDEDLNQPMKALHWCRSQIGVIVTKNKPGADTTCDVGCDATNYSGISTGEAMPIHYTLRRIYTTLYGTKFGVYKDNAQLGFTRHWAFPPGIHSYRTPVEDPNFGSYGPIEAVDCHLHTFCQKLSLIERTKDGKEKVLFTIHCQTASVHSPGTVPTRGLVHIDYLTPANGIALNKNADHILEATYNNPTKKKQDAMAGAIMLCWDRNFQKPAWAR